MPYTSYFESPKSIQNQWNLGANDAKTVWEVWGLVSNELGTTYKDKIPEAQGYFTQKPGALDDPETVKKYKSVKVDITKAQFKKLVDIHRAQLLMRALHTGNQKAQAQTDYKMIWSPLKGKMGGDANEAESLATSFNNTYVHEERLHYVNYLTKLEMTRLYIKPWVVEKNDTFTLRVWDK